MRRAMIFAGRYGTEDIVIIYKDVLQALVYRQMGIEAVEVFPCAIDDFVVDNHGLAEKVIDNVDQTASV